MAKKINEPPVLEFDDVELFYLFDVLPPHYLFCILLEHMMLVFRYFLTAGLSEQEAKEFLSLIEKATNRKKEKERELANKKKEEEGGQ